ncbi:MAG: rod shape-determining protein RodA [Spirochaetales bacterium]|nr:rod shape-determining protein RodA [Spirochaetales bacterium]
MRSFLPGKRNSNQRPFSIMGYDFVLILTVITLTIIGILFIYSSGITSIGENVSNEYLKQIFWGISGIVIMFIISFIDYRRIKLISLYLYIFFIFLLLITVLFGAVRNGARSWLGIGALGIQPSEFAKIATIIFLASYLEDNSKEIESFRVFATACIIVALPTMLIMAQPDLGTTLVFFPILMSVLYIGGANLKYLGFVILLIILSSIFITFNAWDLYLSQDFKVLGRVFNDSDIMMYFILGMGLLILLSSAGYILFRKRVYFWLLYIKTALLMSYFLTLGAFKALKGYQLMRLVVFLNPQVDPRGSGWNIIQSVTAVGSGGISGKGFLQGTQSHYRFLPQQSTDFIFSIFAEESGFLGSLVLFFLFSLIIIRGLYIVSTSKDRFGAYISAGIVGMFSFHIIENIGMAIGIMPITGIPLLFLSYGGSSLWTAFISIGIMLSIHQKRYRD